MLAATGSMMTAGIETLKVLSQPGIYERLENTASRLEEGIAGAASSHNFKLSISRFASLLTIFFTDSPAVDYESISGADTALFAKFFQQLLSKGVYWPPSQFESAFVSLVHDDRDIDITIKTIGNAFNQL